MAPTCPDCDMHLENPQHCGGKYAALYEAVNSAARSEPDTGGTDAR